MTSKSRSDCKNMRVNLTVQTLHGIQVSKEIMSAHHVTAAVAFTSSVKDMEVSSSTLCSTSGRLMVESHHLCFIDREDDDDSVLSASWFEQENTSSNKNLPHVSLSLPMSQQSQPISLSRSNRDCCMLEEPADTDKRLNTSRNAITTLPRSSYSGTLRRSVSCPSNAPYQTNEALWSTSRALLPEIIELAVKVRVVGEEESQNTQGIAFLVIFRHQETGSFLLDLPVRLLKKADDVQRSVGLAKDARLVLKVELFSQPTKPFETIKRTLSVAKVSPLKAERLNLSANAMEARISCLLDTIEKNEKEVLDLLQAQKRAMEVVVPAKSRDTKECIQPKIFATSSYWTTFIAKLFSNVDQCGMGATVKWHREDDSVASTIATQDSFDF